MRKIRRKKNPYYRQSQSGEDQLFRTSSNFNDWDSKTHKIREVTSTEQNPDRLNLTTSIYNSDRHSTRSLTRNDSINKLPGISSKRSISRILHELDLSKEEIRIGIKKKYDNMNRLQSILRNSRQNSKESLNGSKLPRRGWPSSRSMVVDKEELRTMDLSGMTLAQGLYIRKKRKPTRKEWRGIFRRSNLRLTRFVRTHSKYNPANDKYTKYSLFRTNRRDTRIRLGLAKTQRGLHDSQNHRQAKKFNRKFKNKSLSQEPVVFNTITSAHDETEKGRCQSLLQQFKRKINKIEYLKKMEELEQLREKDCQEIGLNSESSSESVRIPKLVNAGKRKSYRKQIGRKNLKPKLGFEPTLEEIWEENVKKDHMHHEDLATKIKRLLKERSVEDVRLDWRVKQKLIEYDDDKTEVETLEKWRETQRRMGKSTFDNKFRELFGRRK